MATDPERRKRIQEDVRWLRGQTINLDDDSPSWPFESWVETIAFIAESARHEGHDEGEVVEVVLTMVALDREALLEADSVLRPLGYAAISTVLRRLARRAPPRPLSLSEQWKRRADAALV